mmetsp:Transcript_13893/g.39526  ORF Transcript_13893/g.39526 Transcript_13893/m.39526 type:complete len:556 (-) Transcript_13893:1866-3533(-)
MALLHRSKDRTNSFHSHGSYLEEEIIEEDEDYFEEEVVEDDDEDDYIEEEIIEGEEEEEYVDADSSVGVGVQDDPGGLHQQQPQQQSKATSIGALHEHQQRQLDDDEEEESLADDDSSAFDDNSTVPNLSMRSERRSFDASLGPSFQNDKSVDMLNKKKADIQMELQRAAESEGARKALEEELAREKSRLAAAKRNEIAQRSSSQLETIGGYSSRLSVGGDDVETRRQRETMQRQRERDEQARQRLAEEIRKVDMALAKKREMVSQTRAFGVAEVEKRKKALAELRRHKAREELARKNNDLQAARENKQTLHISKRTPGTQSHKPEASSEPATPELARSAANHQTAKLEGANRTSSRGDAQTNADESAQPQDQKAMNEKTPPTSNHRPIPNDLSKRRASVSSHQPKNRASSNASTASSNSYILSMSRHDDTEFALSSSFSNFHNSQPIQGSIYNNASSNNKLTTKRRASFTSNRSRMQDNNKHASSDSLTTMPTTFYTIDELRFTQQLPNECDLLKRELYLSPSDFQKHFHMSKEEFLKQPKWKRDKSKRAVGLF